LIVVQEYDIIKNGKILKKGGVSERAKLKDRIDYTKCLALLEAIDDKSFYAIAKDSDYLILRIQKARKKYKKIKEDVLDKLFPTTKVGEWFNADGLKSKKATADKLKSDKIGLLLDEFILTPSAEHLYKIVFLFRNEFKIKYKREELGRTIATGLKESHSSNRSVYETVKEGRNILRRTGSKVHGKCLGTTLLTKGLEFDTVVLLNAHRFNSPEHLYVALTRCCKRLIIFTENTLLSPY
jgi:superfamily I DNA/RNA helicase